MNVSKQEAQKFWVEVLGPIITPLFENAHPDRPVQEVFNKLLEEIRIRYSYKIEVRLNDFFHPKSRKIYAWFQVGKGPEGNIPEIGIVVPPWLVAYRENKARETAGWEDVFRNEAILSVCHEVCHLAFERTLLVHGVNPSGIVLMETEAWADTCEQFIDLYMERGSKLYTCTIETWQAWLRSDRDRTRRSWRKFIQRMYRHVT